MCLDAAYDSKPVREELKERGYLPHIRPAGKKEREREGAVHRHGGRAGPNAPVAVESGSATSVSVPLPTRRKPRTT